MKKKSFECFSNRILLMVFFVLAVFVPVLNAARYMENLNRGVVAVRVNTSSVYVGWRMLGTEPSGISFNVYRGGVKVNATPITASTNYTDNVTTNASYYIRPVLNGVEQPQSETVSVWGQQYLTVPLQQPAAQSMPDGSSCNFTACDASTADLDGDGAYEIILKWDPSNSKDNSQAGYTGDCILDAYKLNGTRLWRVNLGRNIRAGAHYTQFQVFDYDSDGKAELICKTAPGTKDSSGNYLSIGPAASDNDATDYRNSDGYILTGPEYLTVFNGLTGREAYTTNYNPARGSVSSWGDAYGNRVDRFLAATAYLDGVHPSVVMCRGYYTRAVLVAYDWNGSVLTQRWIFDSNASGNSAYAGQGNHNLAVGDVDSDGRDEIVYGACAINDDGKGMYSTGRKHGDAGHLGKMDPNRPGLQYFEPHENAGPAGGGEYRDAATGTLLWGYAGTADTGRGMAADINAATGGYEFWTSATDGVYNINGTRVSSTKPSVNFRIYWDGDLQDELLDGTKLDKWTGNGTSRLITFSSLRSSQEINGTKANPCLSADILGDWREEVIYRNSSNTELNIFTTTIPTNYRFYTLMHDFVYRCSIAWQNTAYNQPPHTGFFLGNGPSAQPVGNIIYPGGNQTPTQIVTVNTATFTSTRTATNTFTKTATPVPPTNTFTSIPPTNTFTPIPPTNTATETPVITPVITLTPVGYREIQLENPCSMNGVLETTNAGYTGAGYANLDNVTGSAITIPMNSEAAQAVILTFRFANGSANSRNMAVSVNGVVQVASLNFAGTGAWTTWMAISAAVTLTAGDNIITLTSLTAEGGANLDMVSFVSETVNAGICIAPTVIDTVETPAATDTATVPTPIPTTPVPTNTATVPTPIPTTPVPTNTATVPTPIPTTPVPTNTATVPTPIPTTPVPTSTNTPVTPSPTPTTGTVNFSVKLKSAAIGSTSSPHPHLQIINTGSAAINLNTVELRYWINYDGTNQAVQAYLDWAGKIPQGISVNSNVLLSTVTKAQGTQTHYISVKFTGGLTIAANESVEMQTRYNKSDWSNMQQDNDWSYGAYSAFTATTTVTGYVNGVLVYGTEPSAAVTNQSAAIQSVLSYPNPATTGSGATLTYNISGTGISAQGINTTIPDPDAKVKLQIFTSTGRLIWNTELSGASNVSTGTHSVNWDGKSPGGKELAAGTYILKVSITSNGKTESRNFVILMMK